MMALFQVVLSRKVVVGERASGTYNIWPVFLQRGMQFGSCAFEPSNLNHSTGACGVGQLEEEGPM